MVQKYLSERLSKIIFWQCLFLSERLSDICGMENGKESQDGRKWTAAGIAEVEGVSLDAIRKRWKVALNGLPFERDRQLAETEAELLRRGNGVVSAPARSRKVSARKLTHWEALVSEAQQAAGEAERNAEVLQARLDKQILVNEEMKIRMEQAESETPTDWGMVIRYFIQGLDMLLIVVGFAFLFDFRLPGFISGLIVSAFMVQGLVVLRNPNNSESSDIVLFGYFLISVGSVWLHKQTLTNYMNAGAEINGSAEWVNWTISVSISLLCFFSAWTTRKVTVENS